MNQAQTLVSIALGEVGYLEKKSNYLLDNKTANAGYNNYTKYGKWYQNNVDGSASYINAAWCDMFKTKCAHDAGVTSSQIPYTAYCPNGVNWFKKKGLWHDPRYYTPKTGDIIYFKDSSGIACHVGIVEKPANGRVYTVEGNTSSASGVVANGGCVARKSYSLTYSRILGYGTPLYKDELTTAEVNNTIKSYAPSVINTAIDNYFKNLTTKGLSTWAINEGFMESAVKAKITDGTKPQAFMSREEFATVIIRLLESYMDKA